MTANGRDMSALKRSIASLRQGCFGVVCNLKRLMGDRQGVGGVEFALVAPMLIVLYLMAFELTMGLSVAKKASMASSTIADLVSREEAVDKTFLAGMADVSGAIFVPYPSKDLLINVSAIKIDSSKAAKVLWSWSTTGVAPYAAGTDAPVPADMLVADTFLIRSELSVSHELMMYLPGLSGTEAKNLTIAREYYFRQRLGTEIKCGNC
ncbi:TadE/TadG family type IV pilus assembly protein [Agrobacterium sp. MA01]|uniref:TadE/TadG family type IV pilus assembly protein n=1 Tax=Agrobacterium sp. MA01 TaxID=2664893 RepID=UPI001FEF06A8|nr:TadE/TadG family type IV pilus assembly protein [Agrobacterium sp. MA01]